jgi:iron complex outermembrane receptor protein
MRNTSISGRSAWTFAPLAAVGVTFALAIGARTAVAQPGPTTAPSATPAATPSASPAASPAAVAPAADDLTLETVIVTAEKREQRLQDVPASVTALGGKEIEDAQITDLRDATYRAPNVINSTFSAVSRQPTNTFHADTDVTFGSYNLQDYRGDISGPIIKDKLFFSLSGGFSERNGYSQNLFDNQPLDGRNHLFGKAQLLWTPTDRLDIRLIVNAERDDDGDFPLYDLASLRRDPRSVDHDFTGVAQRDLAQYALNAAYHGESIEITDVFAFQQWSSHEVTDLDESPEDLLRRRNNQSEYNFINELRLANPADKPIVLGPDAKLKYLAGLFAFRQDQSEFIGNETRPAGAQLLGSPFPFTAFTDAQILNYGVGVYGDTTLTLYDKLEISGGVRYDYEHDHGNIVNSNSVPEIPGSTIEGSREFDQVSPRAELGYHWTKDLFTYASANKGYKAGGYNLTPPPDPSKNSFGPEKSLDYELGVKSDWLQHRVALDADLFYIDWRHQQLDVPTGEPSVYFTDNVGKSQTKGAELEATIRPLENWDIFGGIGYTNAQFRQYTQTNGVSANGHQLPFAPTITWNVGSQYTLQLRPSLKSWIRAEVLGTGRYFYDASNAASQDMYILTNFRVGVGGTHWRVEGYLNNAFNTHYVPIAFPFQLAASGYVGESGDPQTAGVRLGFSY